MWQQAEGLQAKILQKMSRWSGYWRSLWGEKLSRTCWYRQTPVDTGSYRTVQQKIPERWIGKSFSNQTMTSWIQFYWIYKKLIIVASFIVSNLYLIMALNHSLIVALMHRLFIGRKIYNSLNTSHFLTSIWAWLPRLFIQITAMKKKKLLNNKSMSPFGERRLLHGLPLFISESFTHGLQELVIGKDTAFCYVDSPFHVNYHKYEEDFAYPFF